MLSSVVRPTHLDEAKIALRNLNWVGWCNFRHRSGPGTHFVSFCCKLLLSVYDAPRLRQVTTWLSFLETPSSTSKIHYPTDIMMAILNLTNLTNKLNNPYISKTWGTPKPENQLRDFTTLPQELLAESYWTSGSHQNIPNITSIMWNNPKCWVFSCNNGQCRNASHGIIVIVSMLRLSVDGFYWWLKQVGHSSMAPPADPQGLGQNLMI